MSEEVKKNPGMELGEAELESASGGFDFSGTMQYAKGVCRYCPLLLSKACDQKSHLARYILSMYPNVIYEYTECPYYK